MHPTMGLSETTLPSDGLDRGAMERVEGRGEGRGEINALALRARLMEVEAEHLRLQRLVAELLIKNQKLRELLRERAGTSVAQIWLGS